MNTRQLMAIVQARGLKIEMHDGRPVIVPNGHRAEVTDALLAVLKVHKDRIIAILQSPPKE